MTCPTGMIPNLLEQIDKESFLAIIISLPKQLAEQATLHQELRDQVVKNSAESAKLSSHDGLKKPRIGTLRRKTCLHRGAKRAARAYVAARCAS